MERNVARIGEGECGNDKWMESESGEDGKCVWSEMWDCAGWQMWGKDTGHNKSSRAGCTDTWHCLVIPFTEHCYRIPSQGTVSGLDKSSSAGGDDGAVVQEHGKSLPGTAWTWHCDIRGAHGDICKVQ